MSNAYRTLMIVAHRKPCVTCGAYFTKGPRKSMRAWRERTRFCGRQCMRGVGARSRWAKYQRPPPPNPSGRCQCGCGGITPLAKYSQASRSMMGGEHTLFILGHNLKRDGNRGHPSGELHPFWQGEDATYAAAHLWLSKHYEKTECEECGAQKHLQWAYQGPTGGHSRNRSDYRVMCALCHKRFDMARRVS